MMLLTRSSALIASTLLCAFVAGCGDGGSGGIASTPTPPSAPPPAGANANLLGSLKSETFVNDAAQASLAYPGTMSASATTANFVYNASTQSYTIQVGGASKTFAPSTIDASLTNSAETVYEITSGNTTDSLTVTKPGTSGRFTYEYVGAAFWQSMTINGNSGSGSLYAVAYGEPTPTAAVPITGQAYYSIDLIGAYGGGTSVYGVTGQGQLAIDLATDKLVLGGTLLSSTGTAFGAFSGYATLASNGTFTGGMAVDPGETGEITGRLYGPAAQEIGGTYSVSQGSSSDGSIGTGAIIGRSEAADAPATSFTDMTAIQFQNAPNSRQYISGTGANAVSNIGVALNGPANLGVFFENGYTSTTYFSTGMGENLGEQIGGIFNPAAPYGGVRPFNTQYVFAVAGGGTDSTGQFYDYTLLGLPTPASAIPTSGSAAYSVAIDGTLTNVKTGLGAVEISGTAAITVNFATGAVATGGTLAPAFQYHGDVPFGGTWSGSGTLAAGTGNFTTNFAMATTATYSGSVAGQLFGPAASEVGAVFNASGSDGSNISGAMTGYGGVTGAAREGHSGTNATMGSANAAGAIAYDPVSKTYEVAGVSAAAATASPELHLSYSGFARTDTTAVPDGLCPACRIGEPRHGRFMMAKPVGPTAVPGAVASKRI